MKEKIYFKNGKVLKLCGILDESNMCLTQTR